MLLAGMITTIGLVGSTASLAQQPDAPLPHLDPVHNVARPVSIFLRLRPRAHLYCSTFLETVPQGSATRPKIHLVESHKTFFLRHPMALSHGRYRCRTFRHRQSVEWSSFPFPLDHQQLQESLRRCRWRPHRRRWRIVALQSRQSSRALARNRLACWRSCYQQPARL